jgi:HSP20 family protein
MAKRKTGKETKGNDSKALQRKESDADLTSRITNTPFAFMKRFGEEMDRMFEDFGFGRGWLAPVFKGDLGEGLWSPQIEMLERDGQLIVRADLPGLTKDDVKVELSNDAITIEGERKGEREEKGEGYYRSERSYGKFYRRLPVPEGVDVKDANATFRNGVLEISMSAPKRVSQKTKRLDIRGDGDERPKSRAAAG